MESVNGSLKLSKIIFWQDFNNSLRIMSQFPQSGKELLIHWNPALRELQKRQKFKTFIFLSQNSIKYVNNVKTKWIRLLQNSLIFVMHKRHKIKTFRCPVTKLNQRCYNCQNYFYAGMKLFQILVCRKTKNARTF